MDFVDAHRDILWLSRDGKEPKPYDVNSVKVEYPSICTIIRGEEPVPVYFMLNHIKRIECRVGSRMGKVFKRANGRYVACAPGFNEIPLDLFEIGHDVDFNIFLTVHLEKLVRGDNSQEA